MKRALIVDDDTQLRSLMKQLLERRSYTVSEASSGEGALDLLKSYAFALVVIDMMLPGKDGLEVLREIKDLVPNLRAIAISGGLQGDISWLAPLVGHFGVRSFLKKPFDMAEFSAAVDQALVDPDQRRGYER